MYQEAPPTCPTIAEQPEPGGPLEQLGLTPDEFEQLDPHVRLLAAIECRAQSEDPTFTDHTELIAWMQEVSGLERQDLVRANRFLHGEHDFMHLETTNGKRMVVDPLGKAYLEKEIAVFKQKGRAAA